MRMGRCFCASRGILKHCQSLMYMVITNSLINFGNIIVSNYKPNFGLKSLNLPFRNILLAIIKNEDGCGRFWFSLDIGFLGEWLSEFNDPQQTLHCHITPFMLPHAVPCAWAGQLMHPLSTITLLCPPFSPLSPRCLYPCTNWAAGDAVSVPYSQMHCQRVEYG